MTATRDTWHKCGARAWGCAAQGTHLTQMAAIGPANPAICGESTKSSPAESHLGTTKLPGASSGRRQPPRDPSAQASENGRGFRATGHPFDADGRNRISQSGHLWRIAKSSPAESHLGSHEVARRQPRDAGHPGTHRHRASENGRGFRATGHPIDADGRNTISQSGHLWRIGEFHTAELHPGTRWWHTLVGTRWLARVDGQPARGQDPTRPARRSVDAACLRMGPSTILPLNWKTPEPAAEAASSSSAAAETSASEGA